MDPQINKVIEHLDSLNRQMARQNSLGRMFVVGIVYGIGFFVGSAILATIAFGIFAPIVGHITWVHDAFESGLHTLGK
jgi:hypothetical protein